MNTIKNIIFDLGGVIVDIDYNKPVIELGKIGIHGIESIFSISEPDPMNRRYETGGIDTNEFLTYLKSKSKSTTSIEEVRSAWDSILTGMDKEKIIQLTKLKEKYTLFLLNNINESHIEGVETIVDSYFAGKKLEHYLDHVYYSCRIGKRKPEVETFQFIINHQNIDPTTTLMVDDSIDNIKGAALAGLQTYHISPQDGRTFYSLTKQLFESD